MVTGFCDRARRGDGPVVRHRPRKRRRHREPAGVHVILHVVLRRVREDRRRAPLPGSRRRAAAASGRRRRSRGRCRTAHARRRRAPAPRPALRAAAPATRFILPFCSSSASSSCASRGDITASVRKNDLAGRYRGGKEFMPVLPNCEAAIADAIAERVRIYHRGSADDRPRQRGVGHREHRRHDRLSRSRRGSQTLIASADEALYRAEAGGRNRIAIE